MPSTVDKILSELELMYPEATCELNYSNPFQLLVAVILSAQCTDVRVNKITKELFKKLKTPHDFANVEPKELERLIHSCGFFRNKSKSIIESSKAILEKHGGEVPEDFDELVKLSGVGRKTANVVCSVAFNKDAIAVDTHVFRVAGRLSLSNAKTPDRTEEQLKAILPKSMWTKAHQLFVWHGRYCCKARVPLCHKCNLTKYCSYYQKSIENKAPI